MKNITIKNISNPDRTSNRIKNKMYSVWLGNHVTHYFTSIRETKDFMAKTNKFLNSKLHEIRGLFGQVYLAYNDNWYYMENSYNNLDSKIRNCVKDIEKQFDWLVNNHNSTNYNGFVWSNLQFIIDRIEYICNTLKKMLLEKKHYVQVQKMNQFIALAQYHTLSLANYGKNSKHLHSVLPSFELSDFDL